MAARYSAFEMINKGKSHGAWIFLPLGIAGRAVGALAFGFAGPRKFTSVDRHFADTVSRYCAQALDRVRLRIAAASAIAEASEARLMAEHANNAKTVFLRAMSHELRTPLNAISGYTEILELGIRGVVNPEQIKDLGRIKRAASYLLRLINDVLTIARFEGARPLDVISIPVNSMLAEVDGLCALQAKAKGLTLTVAQCVEEVLVAADAERFQQILLNLITNATKFTHTGGTIDVLCDVHANAVRIRVKDTGLGVRPVDIERVFEPFVQIDRHLDVFVATGCRARSLHQQRACAGDARRPHTGKRRGSRLDVHSYPSPCVREISRHRNGGFSLHSRARFLVLSAGMAGGLHNERVRRRLHRNAGSPRKEGRTDTAA